MQFNRLIPELAVSDVAASLRFYTDVLGFRVRYERPEEGFAFLEREGAHIMIEQYRNESRFCTAPPVRPYGAGVNFQIETDDVDVLYAQVLVKEGAVFLPMEEKWYAGNGMSFGNRQFLVTDPDGYLLRFYQSLGDVAGVAS